MAWKDGFFKRNPTLKYLLLGFSALLFLVVLAATFGSDETREFARDIAENFGWIGPETNDGVKP